MKIITPVFIFLLFFSCRQSVAQEQLGLRLENFSGINAVFLNPAATVSVPFKWDINIVSAGFFFENNYAVVRDASVFALSAQRDNLDMRFAGDVDSETNLPPAAFVFDYFNDNKERFISSVTTLHGPSVMAKFGGHTVGAFYNFRNAFGAANIPDNLSYYIYDRRDFFDTFPVTPFDAHFMLWDEIGINYAYAFETNAGFLSIGTNLKYLRGKEAGYFENINTIDLTKTGEDSIAAQVALLDYGLTTASLSQESFANETTGTGFGIDLGVTATFGGYKDEGYDLKLGIALLDFGLINFTQNTQAHRADITSFTEITTETFDGITEIEDYQDFLNRFSQEAVGSPGGTLLDNKFKMALPTGISVQADYSFNENIYLNFTAIQNTRFRLPGVLRNNVVALTPRYERRWYAFQMPLVLRNHRSFRVGLAGRIAFLTLGTDNIGSLVGRYSDFTGTDFYLGLKFNPFRVGASDRYSGPGRKRLDNKKVKCYF